MMPGRALLFAALLLAALFAPARGAAQTACLGEAGIGPYLRSRLAEAEFRGAIRIGVAATDTVRLLVDSRDAGTCAQLTSKLGGANTGTADGLTSRLVYYRYGPYYLAALHYVRPDGTEAPAKGLLIVLDSAYQILGNWVL